MNPFIRKLRNGTPLTAEDEAILTGLLGPERLRERGDIVAEGTEPQSIPVILRGWACRYKQLEDGRRQITSLMLPGDLCEPFGALPRTQDHVLAALTPVMLSLVPATALREAARRNARIEAALLGELRPRLRSTIALFRAVIGRSARTERDLPGYVAQLEDRLDAIARAQAYADRHGAVDLRSLLADELLHYAASEGERLVLSGPPVHLLARTGQLLALAIHELAVNAVEHGAFGAGRGRLEVSWSVTGSGQDPRLLLSWTETDPKPGDSPSATGSGWTC